MADNFDLKKYIIESKVFTIPKEVKGLEKYGVKITVDKFNKVSLITRIGIPVDLDDKTYDKIYNILDRYNLKSKKYFIEKETSIKEMARIAKEKYKLNPNFPQLKDRIKKPTDFKQDRKQQVINYFISQAKEQGVNPMEVELLKSDIEKNSAPGINWSFTPDIRNQLLQATSIKPTISTDEEPSDDDVFMTPSDSEDLFIGKSSMKRKKKNNDIEDEDEPSIKDLPAIKTPKVTGSNMRAGEWFFDNDDLINKIVKQYSQSQIKTGRIVKEIEGGLSNVDFKAAQQRSKETAKSDIPDLIQKLVNKLEDLKNEDYDAYVKVLNDLDKYKFGTTNTKGAMKLVLKGLNEPKIPEMGSKKGRKPSEEDEFKKLGIDDEPIEIDDEE